MAWIDVGTDEPKWVDDPQTQPQYAGMLGGPGVWSSIAGQYPQQAAEYAELEKYLLAHANEPHSMGDEYYQKSLRLSDLQQQYHDIVDPNRGYDSGPWANLAMAAPLVLGGLGAAGALGGAAGTFGAAAPAAAAGSAPYVGAGTLASLGETALPAAGGAAGAGLGAGAVAAGAGGLTAAQQSLLAAEGPTSVSPLLDPASPWSSISGGAGAGVSGGLALSKLSELTGLDPGTLQLLGLGGATGLGMYAANRESNQLSNLQDQFRQDRLPYLQASQGWLANPESYIQGPGQAAMKGTLAGLSANFGNPIGSGTALSLANEAALRDWRGAVTGIGALGLGGENTQAMLGAQSIGARSDVLGNLAGGVSDILNPRRNLASYLGLV